MAAVAPLAFEQAAPFLTAEPPLSLVAEPTEREHRADQVESAEHANEYHDYTGALAQLEQTSFLAYPDLALRALNAESWARMYLGELDVAVSVLDRAHMLASSPGFGDADRAEVLFRLGCCRVTESDIANAVSLFAVSLDLCDRSGQPCDLLRARIYEWRTRCHQRQRDWEAARADVERGLEHAEKLEDSRMGSHLLFQASVIAERQKAWLLARFYGEKALAGYVEAGDRLNEHRLLNNLGGINFLLGERDKARSCLQDSFRIALELDDDVAAGYAMSSLAQVQLRCGEPKPAEDHARKALELLGDRIDHIAEIGDAQLVLGRALLEQGRHKDAEDVFAGAEESFDRFASISHRAAVWMAQGDLAARQGDHERTAGLYRTAAEALQDFNF